MFAESDLAAAHRAKMSPQTQITSGHLTLCPQKVRWRRRTRRRCFPQTKPTSGQMTPCPQKVRRRRRTSICFYTDASNTGADDPVSAEGEMAALKNANNIGAVGPASAESDLAALKTQAFPQAKPTSGQLTLCPRKVIWRHKKGEQGGKDLFSSFMR